MRIEPAGFGSQPLLPAPLEAELFLWSRRALGAALITAVSASWLSLLSWSVMDTSGGQPGGAGTSNALGLVGAAGADVLLTVFGLGVVAVLLAPMCWAIEFFCRRPRLFPVSRLIFFPAAVAGLCCGLSALPLPASWPLGEGIGGLVGDGLFDHASSLLAVVGLQSASGILSIAGLGLGSFAILRAAGVSAVDMQRARADALSRLSFEEFVPTRERVEQWTALAAAPLRSGSRVRSAGASSGRFEPNLPFEPATAGDVDETDRASEAKGNCHLAAPDDSEPLEFDHEDEASRAIALRFAPKASQTGSARRKLRGKGLAVPRPEDFREHRELHQVFTRAEPASAAIARLETVLRNFGVQGTVREAVTGPRVVTYAFEPAPGTRPARVAGLAEDISRALETQAVRVLSVAGRSSIAIEVPHDAPRPILLQGLMASQAARHSDARLPLLLGCSVDGEPVVADLVRMPHLMVAGMTGSGKSVALHAMILSLAQRQTPAECRLVLIDPKGLEFAAYEGLPHLLTPVVNTAENAAQSLEWLADEMDERLKRMAALSVRSIDAFNSRVGAASGSSPIGRKVHTGFDAAGEPVFELQQISAEPMPYVVVVIDDFAELTGGRNKQIESAVRRLAQSARAVGIHMIISTQRPSADSVTGTIKANFPARISFQVASKVDSRTILNEAGAELLLGNGDMLLSAGPGQAVRVHGAFVPQTEIETIVARLRGEALPRGLPVNLGVSVRHETSADRAELDPLYDQAVDLVVKDRRASASYLQRRLQIGYNRAADLIEQMERDKLVSASNGAGRRDVLVANSGRTTIAA